MSTLMFIALVGTARYFADDRGNVYVTEGLRLRQVDAQHEAGLLRRFARCNDRMAREFPGRVLPLTLAHQQRRAADKLEQLLRGAVVP